MYLLNQFKRKKGSKNTKQRKDKGVKRTKKVSTDVQEAYIKSRTARSTAHPYLEGVKEARQWATLANDISKNNRPKKSSNSLRQTVQTAKDIKGLLK